MKKVFKYLLNTSWADIWADCVMYKNLCQNSRAEDKLCADARKNVVFAAGCQWMFVEGDKFPKKCVAQCNTLVENNDSIRTLRRWECPEYSVTSPCKCTDCPNAVYQAEFVAAHQRAMIAWEKRKKFWDGVLDRTTKEK